MSIFWAILLTVLNLGWLVLVVLGLPGTWLMVISTMLLAWWHWDASQETQMFSLITLLAIVIIAALGEVFEFVTGVIGSKKAGGTRWGSVGALVGGIIGAIAATFLIPIPVLGSLLGACIGAALGALGLELYGGLELSASMKSGVGAGVGRFVGTIIKIIAGVMIWIIVTMAAFWP